MNNKPNQEFSINSERKLNSKLWDYIKFFECAVISSSAPQTADIHETAFFSSIYQNDWVLTEDETSRRSLLAAKLLHLRYGITRLNGNASGNLHYFSQNENCYLVVNLNEDPDFYDNLFDLSEFFQQGYFLYKPKGTLFAKLIGTSLSAEIKSSCVVPGYHQAMEVGKFHPVGLDEALSKMRDKMTRINLNPNKNQDADFIGKNVISEETFHQLPSVSKGACMCSAAKVALNHVLPFEDYSNFIRRVKISNPKLRGNGFEYVDCTNVCLILESSFKRVMAFVQNQDFSIVSAFHGTLSKRENIRRNRILRHRLALKNSGVYMIVGHWLQAEKDQNSNLSEVFNDAERLYLIIRENNASMADFQNSIKSALTIFNDSEDIAIIKNTDGIFALDIKGERQKICNEVTPKTIALTYSAYVKKRNAPFIFDGIETPVTNLGSQTYAKYHILH